MSFRVPRNVQIEKGYQGKTIKYQSFDKTQRNHLPGKSHSRVLNATNNRNNFWCVFGRDLGLEQGTAGCPVIPAEG